MALTLKTSCKEFDNGITSMCQKLYTKIAVEPQDSTIKYNFYLYQDFTVDTKDTGRDKICSLSFSRNQFSRDAMANSEVGLYCLRSLIFSEMIKNQKLCYLNKIEFTVR